MAPISDVSPDAPAVLVSVVGFLVAIVLFMLCADKDTQKTKKMRSVDSFSNINPGQTDRTRKISDTPLKLKATVPLSSPTATAPTKTKTAGHQRLGFDAGTILKECFKDDHRLSKLNINEKRLELTEIIGKGNFGLVYKGTLLDHNMSSPLVVAIKTVQGPACSKADVHTFIRESARMRGLSHPHILTISGVVTKDNKPFIILPYMENGDLKSFIANKSRKFTLEDLTRFAYDVAQGMAYLASKNFVHRDLAARNCVVSADNTIKVADFGLSRDLYEADYYKMQDLHTPLPIRWVALESILSSKFTTKSDVWSFGVLMWELLTRGRTPYPGITNHLEVVHYLKSGQRMQCPDYVTDNIRKVTQQCWIADPSERPSFAKVCKILHYILEEDNDYLKPTKGH